jgi:hypothetical protein
MNKSIIIYILIFILLSIILSYYFLYNIYGDEIRKEPNYLYADNLSEMTIQVIPVNALGWKAIFRKSSAKFEIVDGDYLVEIINLDEVNGKIKIRSKGIEGVLGIKIQSEHSLLPEYIEVQILPLKA